MVAKLLAIFAELGWGIAPDSLSRSMGSAHTALASFEVAGATWRIRIGERVTHLERRAHGTPSGRCSSGRWESVGALDTPRRLSVWRELAEALTSEALAFESSPQSGGFGQPSSSQHTRRHAADGSESGGTDHGRGRVGKSNPTRLAAFGFTPAAGFSLLAGRGEAIDANPETTVKAHRERVCAKGNRRALRNAARKRARAYRKASACKSAAVAPTIPARAMGKPRYDLLALPATCGPIGIDARAAVAKSAFRAAIRNAYRCGRPLDSRVVEVTR